MNERTQARLAQAEHNWLAVQLLEANGFYDIAIVRAYYVIFYVVDALLKSKNLRITTHEERIEAFYQQFVLTDQVAESFYQKIKIALDDRCYYDYEAMLNATPEIAQKQLTIAAEFLDLGRSFFDLSLD
jgi:uncharacterized protein (UPF0332 family)